MRKCLFVILLSFILMACGGGETNGDSDASGEVNSEDNNGSPVTDGEWYKPSLQFSWQWQLLGDINEGYAVDIYDIDLFDTPTAAIERLQASGKRVICYFSAGSYEQWRDDAGQFAQTDIGNTLDGWEGESWLDIRSQNVRNIMLSRLDHAKEKGCDGVEPDNMDGYLNSSGFSLTYSNQLDYNRFIATEAHTRGLSVGLKNDLDQIQSLVAYFDFAVNEQCFEYDECELLEPFIAQNKPVLNAEYLAVYVNNSATRNQLCSESINQGFSTLILPLDLDDSFRLSCF